MGILSLFGFGRSRDKPENRTSGSSYSFFLGNSTSGKRVNERTAMQMTAVYSCVRILSEAVASLPLQFYRYTDDGGKEKAVDHPLYFLLHDEPNPEMTSFVFRETLMTHLLLWGNAYAQIIRNGRGEVIALYPLMADRMYVDRDEKGQLYYEYTLSSDDAPTMKGSVVRLSPYEVLHIPGLGFDGLVGYSPIAMAKNAIGMAMACEEYGAKFFANGAAPSGVLEHPGTIKDPSRVRESTEPFRRSRLPAAQDAPTSAPMEVPQMTEGMIPMPSSASMMPMCAQPRAAPPPSASPMFIGNSLYSGRGKGGKGSGRICERRPAAGRDAAAIRGRTGGARHSGNSPRTWTAGRSTVSDVKPAGRRRCVQA